MRGSRRSKVAWAALVAAALSASCLESALAADEKASCIAASDEGQQLRIDGKLTLAHKRLLACARAECPAIVRQDCAQWMAQVDAALPTVVFGARDAEGHDLIAVRVLEDGALVADHLDGRPVPIDPGPHVFRFETPGASPAEVRVLARAGEQNRAITATLGPAPRPLVAAPAAQSLTPVPPTGVPSTEPRASTSPLAWVFGGVAVVALGTALGFEIAQVVDYDRLASTCSGHCAPDEVDHVGTERLVAGVSAGVGAAALGTALYFFFSRPAAGAKPSPIAVGFSPLPEGGIATLGARF